MRERHIFNKTPLAILFGYDADRVSEKRADVCFKLIHGERAFQTTGSKLFDYHVVNCFGMFSSGGEIR